MCGVIGYNSNSTSNISILGLLQTRDDCNRISAVHKDFVDHGVIKNSISQTTDSHAMVVIDELLIGFDRLLGEVLFGVQLFNFALTWLGRHKNDGYF